MTEAWRVAWRRGFAPLMPLEGLLALKQAIETDSCELLQGATCTPPPLQHLGSWLVEAACPVGLCGWKGLGLNTVEETETFFARSCFDADQALGEPAACRWFLNYWDETPREYLFKVMLPEVDRELTRREGGLVDESAA